MSQQEEPGPVRAFGTARPVEMQMKLVDENGSGHEVAWRPELPARLWFLQSVTVLDSGGVPVVRVPFIVPPIVTPFVEPEPS